MSKRVIICRGLPGSGKTTWAKKLIDEYPHQYKRISKDDLRSMLDNGLHSRSNENFIIKVRDWLIWQILHDGKSVIIDDTNLHDKHIYSIRESIEKWNKEFNQQVSVEIKSFLDVPIDQCIENDLNRQNSVGEKVIRDMWEGYKERNALVSSNMYQAWMTPDPNLPGAIICDIDGTLAIKGDRGIYDFDKADKDIVNQPIRELVKQYFALQYKVIIISAREDKYKDITERWLSSNQIPYDYIYMRETGDKREDSDIKKELFNKYVRGKYNIRFVVDDRARVCDMWRNLGLLVLQVAEGNY